ncbi:tetratricopeptide repeat protein [Archangium sp.]|uniref:tetratricopeptide repeat protein n=1 Tax=Archangium sp. TaxID=1872627 RepID=UPI002D38949F|nr:tetratricopeptide repeat protein [Archangium sp.]HYO53789.1 tetratricopeptide repeat protein [Archangium sp.]
MSKRSKRHHQAGGGGLLEERLRAARVAVNTLLEEGRTEEARAVLTQLESRHPDNPRVLETLADLTYEIGDMQGYQAAAERLLEFRPDDADLFLAVAGAALNNLYPVTGLQRFRRFLQRWPSHPLAPEVRKTVAELEGLLPELLSILKVSGEEAVPAVLEHERIQHLLATGRAREAREAAQQALRAARPPIPAVLNNLGRAAWVEGDFAQAEAAFRQVLDSHPQNVHALGNLATQLLVSGRMTEATEVAGRLKASTDPASERWLKVAEALSYLGDDAGVLEAFEKEQQEGRPKPRSSQARLRHLAAVAALRRGESSRAMGLWKRALELMPGLEPARRNLGALDLPVALRPIPWPFELEGWLPPARVNALRQRQEFPEFRHLLPLLLDRGSPEAVRLALGLCNQTADASLLEEVKRFALGERGALVDRFLAARIALSAGVAREDELQLWTGKRRQPYRWLDLQVYHEAAPGYRHSRRVERLLKRALERLRQGDGKQAELLLREALALEPDSPDVLNNLAAARQLQGHIEEGVHMIEELHQRRPEYFFARCSVARLRIRDGRLEEARELLEPLLSQRRLHVTEVATLCPAQMDMLLAEGDTEGAEVWLHILETIRPDDPQIERYHALLDRHSLRKK